MNKSDLNKHSLSYVQQAYEMEALWTANNIAAPDRERIVFTADKVPADVESVLDVGCGGGIFVNYLKKTRRFQRICGSDRSETALKFVETEKVLSDVSTLPFADREFDLVSCLEVLEHVPYSDYEKTLEQLCRISNKYILLSVPNKENLRKSLESCPICYTRFSPDFHVRSFDYSSLNKLLSEYNFDCTEAFFIYKSVRHIGLDWLQKFRATAKLRWYAVCPVCGYSKNQGTNREQARTDVQKSIIKQFIKKLWPKTYRYRWIGALYTRKV